MPRFVQPFAWWLSSSDPDGPLRLIMRSDVWIEVQGAGGRWAAFECMVDTGACFPTMPTSVARRMGLAIPPTASPVEVETADGTTTALVRDGELKVRFLRLPERIFSLKWWFRDDLADDVQPLLGLHNTVDLLTLVFDGTPRPDGLMGCMEFITRDP